MGAYDYIDTENLISRLKSFLPEINIIESKPTEFEFASGLLTHYYVLTEKDYKSL